LYCRQSTNNRYISRSEHNTFPIQEVLLANCAICLNYSSINFSISHFIQGRNFSRPWSGFWCRRRQRRTHTHTVPRDLAAREWDPSLELCVSLGWVFGPPCAWHEHQLLACWMHPTCHNPMKVSAWHHTASCQCKCHWGLVLADRSPPSPLRCN